MATSASTGITSSGATFSALGIGSGVDVQTMITALMSIERVPQIQLKTKKTDYQSKVDQYQTLNTKMMAVRTASQAMDIGFFWKAKTASSSSSLVTATATQAAINGSLSFSVKNLATAQVSASYGTVASTSSVVASGNLLIGTAGGTGIKNLTGSSDLATGAHALEVTQASAGASIKGAPLADSISLNGSETLTTTIDGAPQTFTLTAGTYTPQSLAKMLSTVSNGALSATVNGDKSLQLSTTHEGSTASLSIDGGTSLVKLGLAVSTGAVNGTDGIVKVDGVSNTVTSVVPGSTSATALNSTTGSISATFGSGLRVGTTTLQNVSLGDGALSTVSNNINNSGAGVSATVVQVGAGQYRLQLQSSTTGTAGAIATNFGAFASSLGSMEDVTSAQDATLQVGTGANAYTVSSSSNTVSNVFPGVTLSLNGADPNTTVSVNVGADPNAMSTKVKALVDAVNDALTYIHDNSTYDAKAKKGGPLMGDYTARTLQQQLYGTISAVVGTSSLQSAAQVGIKSNSNNTFDFDADAFKAKFSADPEAVARMFVDGGTTNTNLTGKSGIAQSITSIMKAATNSINGSITTAINGQKTLIADLDAKITSWDDRLSKMQDRFIKQYSAMDSIVSNYQSLGNMITNALDNGNK